MSSAVAKTERRSFHLVQCLRGVAALMVVSLHATTIVYERYKTTQFVWWSGAAGVDIFFVISGFVMALSSESLHRSTSPARQFMRRRVQRVVPLYWLFTTVRVLSLVFDPALAQRALGSVSYVLLCYFFVPAYNTSHIVLPVIPPGWTLNFEMLFYVLFALALAVRVRPIMLIAPVLLLTSLCAVLFPVGYHGIAVMSWCDPIVLEFVFGMLLYQAWKRRVQIPSAVCALLFVLSIVAIEAFPHTEHTLLRPLLWGVPALVIVSCAVAMEERLGGRAPAWLLRLGDASYSIYLSHTFVLPVVAFVLLRVPVAAMRTTVPVTLLALLASSAVGLLSYRYIELPLIHFFHLRHNTSLVAKT